MMLRRSTCGRGAVAKRAAVAAGAAAAPSSRDGFTLIELLTVVAVIGILATLTLTGIAGAKKRSRQTACSGNLRQVALAVELYHDEAGRRPRSFTRLATKPEILPNPKSLLCPEDPALRSVTKRPTKQTLVAWGNLANRSQEPMDRINLKKDLEAPTWELEMMEIQESVGFSYLHPLFWRKTAWKVLLDFGNLAGVSVCQVHGINLMQLDRENPQAKPYKAWEGLTLRAQRDGSVVPRKIFRGIGIKQGNGETSNGPITPVIPGDYPWEFYLDSLPPR